MKQDVKQILNIIETHSNRSFLIDAISGREVTYGVFHNLTCQLSKIFLQKGIQKGDKIGLLLTNSIEFVCSYFACLYVGAIVVPINVGLHPDDVIFILQNSGLSLLVYSSSTFTFVPQEYFAKSADHFLCITSNSEPSPFEGHHIWSLDMSGDSHNDFVPLTNVDYNDLFTLHFTSGTTGVPKGVCHCIERLIHGALTFNTIMEFLPTHRFYHILPMAYMAGFLNNLLCPFLAGASIVIDRVFNARMALQFWKTPIQYGVNTMWLIPSILAALLKLDRSTEGKTYCEEHVDFICVGTASLPSQLKREFENTYGTYLYESYGLSEVLFVTTNAKRFEVIEGSVGPLLPGIKIKIVNAEGNVLPAGKEGEIYIQSPFLQVGYFDPTISKPDPLVEREWFPSGDLGYLSEKGYLFITDRIKDLIIRGGVNVSPRKIEDVILRHNAVEEIAVVGIPHEDYGEEIAAVFKLKNGFNLDRVRPEIEKMCREKLGPSEQPAFFVADLDIPKNINGKIQKRKLKKLIRIYQDKLNL
jgi:acyl-CoA synthetase (AMP-forming)/AMP-acid ligase II